MFVVFIAVSVVAVTVSLISGIRFLALSRDRMWMYALALVYVIWDAWLAYAHRGPLAQGLILVVMLTAVGLAYRFVRGFIAVRDRNAL
jgi:hypothetical protein